MAVPRVAVAVSGGRDSTALLHCTLRAAQRLGIEVIALHVHHGLMAQADDWLTQVRQQSRRWGAAFKARRLQAAPGAGESIEAWARRERYLALAEMAHAADCGLVLLAHHRRDQAETWLLQALRSGGPAGLSAMPANAQREGIMWSRPWLDQPRAGIETYVRRHRLRHINDDSNGDTRFARNRLRLQVWPALLQAFPDAEVALAGAARRAQEAAALAAEVAAQDLPALLQESAMHVAAWLALSPARRRNALHAWLAALLPSGVQQALLQRLLDELPGRAVACWQVPGATFRLHRGLLRLVADKQESPAAMVLEPVDGDVDVGGDVSIDISQPGCHVCPGVPGHFVVDTTAEGGAAALALKAVRAQPRVGGERFSLAPNGMPRSLKKQFQARQVPPWQRDGPLLFTAQGQLLFVPGLGIDGRLQAALGMPQLRIAWQPGPPPAPVSARPGPRLVRVSPPAKI